MDIDVRILDLQANQIDFDYTSFLAKEGFDYIGVTAMTPMMTGAAKFSFNCRRILPKAKLIIGGIHFTALPRRTLEESAFDVGVIGRGVEGMIDLVIQEE